MHLTWFGAGLNPRLRARFNARLGALFWACLDASFNPWLGARLAALLDSAFNAGFSPWLTARLDANYRRFDALARSGGFWRSNPGTALAHRFRAGSRHIAPSRFVAPPFVASLNNRGGWR